LKTYFINLDRDVERRAHMERQFFQIGLEVDRFAATAIEDLPAGTLERFADPRRPDWQSPAEIACTFSHTQAMRDFLASTAEHALIFEDDVIVSPRLVDFLAAFADDPPDWDLTRLETFSTPVVLWPAVTRRLAGIELFRPSGYVAGSAGYIISRRGAELFLADPVILSRIIDWSMNHPFDPVGRRLSIRHAVPALCVQLQNAGRAEAGALSNLSPGRAYRAEVERSYGLRRLPYRLHQSAFDYLWIRPRNLLHRILGARKRMVPFLGPEDALTTLQKTAVPVDI
jgi:glycosyl transferase family 25